MKAIYDDGWLAGRFAWYVVVGVRREQRDKIFRIAE